MRIISGGQAGVDRAALDCAVELGIPSGGWCPKGRRAEDGPLPSKYPLQETPSGDYQQRTEWNVCDSDGTLILTIGKPSGGTAVTIEFARRHHKPHLVIDLGASTQAQTVSQWIARNQIETLNVAGPRASEQHGIYNLAVAFLKEVLARSSPVSVRR